MTNEAGGIKFSGFAQRARACLLAPVDPVREQYETESYTWGGGGLANAKGKESEGMDEEFLGYSHEGTWHMKTAG